MWAKWIQFAPPDPVSLKWLFKLPIYYYFSRELYSLSVFTPEFIRPVQFSMHDVYRSYEGTRWLNVRGPAGSSRTSIRTDARLLGFTLQKTTICIITTMRTWNQTRRFMTFFKKTCHGLRPLPEESDTYLHSIEAGSCSRCSDWLRAGRPRGRTSSPYRDKIFLLFTSSTQFLGPTQPPIQWVPGALPPGVKRPGREAKRSAQHRAKFTSQLVYIRI
jgi:hypothetical protein